MLLSPISALLAFTTLTSSTPLSPRSPCLTAEDLITISPNTSTCSNTGSFPTECAPASLAAPAIASSFKLFRINTFGAQAALVSLILFESGDFKFSKNHFPAPGTPGQGTRNMQSPEFNGVYAEWIAESGLDGNITKEAVEGAKREGPAEVLELVNTDRWGFASAAWFLRTQCDESVAEELGDAQQESFEAYLTKCVGTTVTEERIEGWERVVGLGGW